MIKETNERITITLTKEEKEKLNIISEESGHSKSTLIKIAIDYIFQKYKNYI